MPEINLYKTNKSNYEDPTFEAIGNRTNYTQLRNPSVRTPEMDDIYEEYERSLLDEGSGYAMRKNYIQAELNMMLDKYDEENVMDNLAKHSLARTISEGTGLSEGAVYGNIEQYVRNLTGVDIKKDDGFKGWLSQMNDTWSGYSDQLDMADSEFKALFFDEDSYSYKKYIEMADASAQKASGKQRDFSKRTWVGNYLVENAQFLAQQWDQAKYELGGRALGAVLGGAFLGISGAKAGAKVVGTTTGLVSRAFNSWKMFKLEAGSFAREMRQMVDSDGNALSQDIIRETALGYATASSIVEQFDLVEIGIEKLAKKALGDTKVNNVIMTIMSSIGRAVLESNEEGIQQALQTLALESAKEYSNELGLTNFELEADKFGKALKDGWKEFYSTLGPMGLTSLMGIGFTYTNVRSEDIMKSADKYFTKNHGGEYVNLKSLDTGNIQINEALDAEKAKNLKPITVIREKIMGKNRYKVASEEDAKLAEQLRLSGEVGAKAYIIEATDSKRLNTSEMFGYNNWIGSNGILAEGNTQDTLYYRTQEELDKVKQIALKDKGTTLTETENGAIVSGRTAQGVPFSFNLATSNEDVRKKFKNSADSVTFNAIKKAMPNISNSNAYTGAQAIKALSQITGKDSVELIDNGIINFIGVDKETIGPSLDKNKDAYLSKGLTREQAIDLTRGWTDSYVDKKSGKTIYNINLTSSANERTLVHEVGHILRAMSSKEQLSGFVGLKGYVGELGAMWACDIKNVGDKFQLGSKMYDTYQEAFAETRANEEKFVDDFLAYIETGRVASAKVKQVFDKIKELLVNFNSFLGKEISPEAQKAFDNLINTPSNGQESGMKGTFFDISEAEERTAKIKQEFNSLISDKEYWKGKRLSDFYLSNRAEVFALFNSLPKYNIDGIDIISGITKPSEMPYLKELYSAQALQELSGKKLTLLPNHTHFILNEAFGIFLQEGSTGDSFFFVDNDGKLIDFKLVSKNKLVHEINKGSKVSDVVFAVVRDDFNPETFAKVGIKNIQNYDKDILILSLRNSELYRVNKKSALKDTFDLQNAQLTSNLVEGLDTFDVSHLIPNYIQQLRDVNPEERVSFDVYSANADNKYKFTAEDRQYIEYLKQGKEHEARKIVESQASKQGYAPDSSYQGTSAFNGSAPANDYMLSKKERIENWDNGDFDGNATLGDYKDGIDINNLDWMLNSPNAIRDNFMSESISNLKRGLKSGTITVYRSVPASIKESKFRNGDWVTPSRSYAVENADIHGWEDGYRIIEQEVSIEDIWWDGNDINEWGYDDGKSYVYKNTKNNIKSFDTVTYDSEGYIIPPSKRFNYKNESVFFDMDIPTTLQKYSEDVKYGIKQNGDVVVVSNDIDKAMSEIIPAEYSEIIKGRRKGNTITFTSSQATFVRNALSGSASFISNEINSNYRYTTKDGKKVIVGAPPEYNTPAKVRKLRAKVTDLVLKGIDQQYWYERSSNAFLQMANGDKELAKKYVGLLSIFSNNTPVSSNTTYELRAVDQYIRGLEIKTGRFPNATKKRANDFMYKDSSWKGIKTNNFFNNLLVLIDENVPQGVTVDMWMMRAFEYGTDALSDARSEFVRNEVSKIAKDVGMTPWQAQACIWTGIMRQYEGKEDVNKFERNYEDFLIRNTTQVSFEAQPSIKSGILSGSHTASDSLKNQFFREAMALLFEGKNFGIAEIIGLQQQGAFSGAGYFEEVSNPSLQARFTVQSDVHTKSIDGVKYQYRTVTEADKEKLNQVCAVLGLLLGQDAVCWNKQWNVPANELTNAITVQLGAGRTIRQDEIKNLGLRIKKECKSREISNFGNIGLIASPYGVYVTNFSFGSISQETFYDIAKKCIDDFAESLEETPDNKVQCNYYRHESDYISNDWSVDKNGEGYLAWFSKSGQSDILKSCLLRYAPAIKELRGRYSRDYGWGETGFLPTTESEVDSFIKQSSPSLFDIASIDEQYNIQKQNVMDSYKQGLKNASERGVIIAPEYLKMFSGEQWADNQLSVEKFLSANNDLKEDFAKYETFEDWLANSKLSDMFVNQNNGENLTEILKASFKLSKSVTATQASRNFINTWTSSDEKMLELSAKLRDRAKIGKLSDTYFGAYEGISPKVLYLYGSPRDNGRAVTKSTHDEIEEAKNIVKANPETYRLAYVKAYDDYSFDANGIERAEATAIETLQSKIDSQMANIEAQRLNAIQGEQILKSRETIKNLKNKITQLKEQQAKTEEIIKAERELEQKQGLVSSIKRMAKFNPDTVDVSYYSIMDWINSLLKEDYDKKDVLKQIKQIDREIASRRPDTKEVEALRERRAELQNALEIQYVDNVPAEASNYFTDAEIRRFANNSLDWSIEDLNTLYTGAWLMRSDAQAKLQAKKNAEFTRRIDTARGLLNGATGANFTENDIRNGYDIKALADELGAYRGDEFQFNKALLQIVKMGRLARLLDGNKEGSAYDFFIRKVYENQSIERIGIRNRTAKRNEKYKELGLTPKELQKVVFTYNHKGQEVEINKAKAIGVYVYNQQVLGQEKLVNKIGNGLSLEDIQTIIGSLSENEKAFGDFLIEDMSSQYKRLSEHYQNVYNRILGKRMNYFPFISLYAFTNQEIGDFLAQKTSQEAYVSKTFTKETNPNAIYELDLDVINGWDKVMRRQEHFIAYAEWARDAEYILGHGNYKSLLEAKFGTSVAKNVEEYVNFIGAPAYKGDDFDSLLNSLIGRLSGAKIIANLSSVVKQVGTYGAGAKSEVKLSNIIKPDKANFLNLLRAVNITSASGETYNTWKDFMYSMAPELFDRQYDSDMQKLLNEKDKSAFGVGLSRVSNILSKPLQWVDSWVVETLWTGCFLTQMEKSAKSGNSISDRIKESAFIASQLIAETQNTTERMDMNAMMRKSSEGDALMKLMTAFQSQTMNIANEIWYDIPQALRNNKMDAIRIAGGLLFNSLCMIAIKGFFWKRDDEDDEETKKRRLFDILSEFAENFVPIAGGDIMNKLQGYSSEDLIEGFGSDLVDLLKGITKTIKSEEEFIDILGDAVSLAGDLTGIGSIGLKRVYQMINNDFNIGYLLNSTWGHIVENNR